MSVPCKRPPAERLSAYSTSKSAPASNLDDDGLDYLFEGVALSPISDFSGVEEATYCFLHHHKHIREFHYTVLLFMLGFSLHGDRLLASCGQGLIRRLFGIMDDDQLAGPDNRPQGPADGHQRLSQSDWPCIIYHYYLLPYFRSP